MELILGPVNLNFLWCQGPGGRKRGSTPPPQWVGGGGKYLPRGFSDSPPPLPRTQACSSSITRGHKINNNKETSQQIYFNLMTFKKYAKFKGLIGQRRPSSPLGCPCPGWRCLCDGSSCHLVFLLHAGLYLQLYGLFNGTDAQSRSSGRGPKSFLIPWSSAITCRPLPATPRPL